MINFILFIFFLFFIPFVISFIGALICYLQDRIKYKTSVSKECEHCYKFSSDIFDTSTPSQSIKSVEYFDGRKYFTDKEFQLYKQQEYSKQLP